MAPPSLGSCIFSHGQIVSFGAGGGIETCTHPYTHTDRDTYIHAGIHTYIHIIQKARQAGRQAGRPTERNTYRQPNRTNMNRKPKGRAGRHKYRNTGIYTDSHTGRQ